MTYWNPTIDRDHLIAVALGERPADLAIRGGRVVDVHTGEIYPADVAIAGSRIAAVGDIHRSIGDETRVVDAAGRHLVPGFIDCHVHIGASGLAMTQLARLFVPLGTAAIVTDFYEPAAMRGVDAMRFLLDETARTPLKAYFSPFCPAFDEDRFGTVTPERFEEVLRWPECVEVREWYLDRERGGSPAERAIGARAREAGRILSGHLPDMPPEALQASVAAGIRSDHEATTAEHALRRVRLGVAMQVRFGSGRRHEMADVLRAVVEHGCDSRMFMFSTDEEDVDDIADLGHIDHRVRLAVAHGVPPVDAIRMASLNAATFLGVTGDLGSIAPGRLAFVNLVDDLAACRVSTVVAGPRVVARDGRYVGPEPPPVEYPAGFRGTVRLGRTLAPEDFRVPAAGDRATVRAIGSSPTPPRWRDLQLDLPVRDGGVAADPANDVAKVAGIERHRGSGAIGLGFLQGFGLQRGAFGCAFHPVAMDVGVIGADDADMALVANRIAELGGGYVAALGGEVIAEVALPLLGYLSAEPAEEVVERFRAVRTAIAERLGCRVPGLYTTMGFPFVPVAPGLHVVAEGLVRVEYGEASRRIPLSVVVE